MSRPPSNYGAVSSTNVSIKSKRSVEFNTLCDNVVTNIYTINSALKTLDTSGKSIGTKRDNQGLRNQIHVSQLSTNQIASETSKEIHKLKCLIPKGDKSSQLQVERLESNFKDTITRYHALQKELANKQKKHLLVTVSIENQEQDEGIDQERQIQISRDVEFEKEMLLDRESRIKQIESDVIDINQIMRELGSLVQAQGEQIDTIENSIDHAVGNVEEATEQLATASRYQNKYRKKMLCLIVLGVMIFGVLALIVYLSIKNN